MKTLDEKKAFLEAAKRLSEKRKDERQRNYFAKKASVDTSQNLSKGSLDKEVMKAPSNMSADVTPTKTIVGKTDKIDTLGDVMPQVSGQEFKKKIDTHKMNKQLVATMEDALKRGDIGMVNKLKTLAGKMSKGLKAVPVLGTAVGALGALAGAQDASAAVPLLDSADSAGMSPQDENVMLSEMQARKDYNKSDAKKDRMAALAKLAKSREE